MPLKQLPLLALLLLVACEESPKRARPDDAKSPSAVAQPVARVHTGNTQGPLASTLSGPEQPRVGVALPLTLRIDRRALHDSVGVSVHVELPAGVVLTHGEADIELPPSEEAEVSTLEFVVRANSLPTQPATFVIDAAAEGFGYHAELAYRFGRAEELPREPVRSAAEVRVSSRNFGAPVDVAQAP